LELNPNSFNWETMDEIIEGRGILVVIDDDEGKPIKKKKRAFTLFHPENTLKEVMRSYISHRKLKNKGIE
jgi:hypothetical protein